MVSLNLGLCVSFFGERVTSLLDLLVSIFESCSEMPFAVTCAFIAQSVSRRRDGLSLRERDELAHVTANGDLYRLDFTDFT